MQAPWEATEGVAEGDSQGGVLSPAGENRFRPADKIAPKETAGDTADTDELAALLEEKLASAVSACLQASSSLRADFLGLAAVVERDDPARFRALTEPFPDLLPQLQLEVTVRSTLDHSPDRED